MAMGRIGWTLLLLLAGCGRSQPTEAQPQPGGAAAVPPTVIGVNLGKVEQVGVERSFANLVGYRQPVMSAGRGWETATPSLLDANGWPLPGIKAEIIYPLGRPTGAYRCTWEGDGQVFGNSANGAQTARGDHWFEMSWGPTAAIAWVSVPPQAGTVKAIDCRERGLNRAALFVPEFVAEVSRFPVLRFVDWQSANDNDGGTWSRRTTPRSAAQAGPAGVAVEHLTALANQANADPWLIVPYRADDPSIEAMARTVHDRLRADGRVYVELGNEIWNGAFPAAQQARAEGVAEQLSADPNEAMLRRYAEKARNALAIWTRVFADRPERLVRVVSTFQGLSSSAETVLSFRDTARFVDALATAPYFTAPLPADAGGLPGFFADLGRAVDVEIGRAVINKAVATKFGKRYIAYEGGQGLTSSDVALLAAIERDPRMGDAYARFLRGWQARVGDLLVLYQLDGEISQFGAWGLRERSGQPDADAPKMRAVRAFMQR